MVASPFVDFISSVAVRTQIVCENLVIVLENAVDFGRDKLGYNYTIVG
jgi:hypothetical protein